MKLLSKSKKWLLPAVITLGVSISACSEKLQTAEVGSTDKIEIEVFKSATCGCCNKWIDHMEESGYKVAAMNRTNLKSIKRKFGIAPNMASCHTAITEDYVFEGHIPADIIARFLHEKPTDVIGLAVPGMPAGSPGMEVGERHDSYDVLMIRKDGSTSVYAHVAEASVFHFKES